MASFDYDVVIIGSGFGGSVAAPFRGVLPLPISALQSGSPVLRNLANRNRAVPLTYEQFCYAFANAVSEEEAHQLYEQFAVPTPGKPLFQAASANLHQPRPGPAADHLGRAGPHRPLGDRQRLLPAAGHPARPRSSRSRAAATPLTIDSGWREVTDTALAFVQRFTS